jgi:alpha-glucosidase/alpha-D-xyloside xylohydrolase
MKRGQSPFYGVRKKVAVPFISRRDALKTFGAAGAAALVRVPTAEGPGIEVAVAPSGQHSVRVTVSPRGRGRTLSVPLDGALAQPATSSSAPVAKVMPPGDRHRIRCGAFNVSISFDPLTVRVDAADGRMVQQLQIDPGKGTLRFPIGDGPLLGLGEGGPQFDRRGSTDAMKNGQGGYRLRTHGGRAPVQWLVGTAGWAMFIHHPQGSFDFTGPEARFDPATDGLPLDLFIVGARDPVQVMAEYARLTGHPEMPPLWSLGYLQSHRTLAGPDEIVKVARTFREKRLPCDALIYLGTGFTPSGWNTNNGEFTWNASNFPDPKRMIDTLHDLNFKVVLHIVLEGRRLAGAVADPCSDADRLPSGRTADGKWPDDRKVSCYWPYHKPLYDIGADGWWPDQGDGLDAPSRLARHRMYWEGSQLWRANERPFALHRNGHAGMQRYAAFLWSGDVYTTWETLRTHVSVAINTGLSGIPYWGTDIGGFVPTAEYTGELHVRWFQFGAFCPLFRAHGRSWHLRLPWGWNTGELGPNEIITPNYSGAANPDASELRNAAVEPICRKYLELRYRLLPYLYSVVRETTRSGLPIMRSLWLHYPDDRIASARGDEYLWGRDILVAPVTEKGAGSRSVYLPHGTWYDFWTGQDIDGGRELQRPVDLATIPLYVRAGAILPLGPVKQFTAEKIDAPFEVRVYPGADGTFTLYEDDGRTFDYRKGEWMGIAMAWDDRARRLTLRLEPGSRMRPPMPRTIEARIAGATTTKTVVFQGRPVSITL